MPCQQTFSKAHLYEASFVFLFCISKFWWFFIKFFFSNLQLKKKFQKNLNFFVEKMVKFFQKQNIILLGF